MVAVCVALVAFVGSVFHPADEFCRGPGIVVASEDFLVVDGRTIVDHRTLPRDPCRGDDLVRHIDLGPAEGVLFDDCRVSWVGGGRTEAEDLGLDCEPAG